MIEWLKRALEIRERGDDYVLTLPLWVVALLVFLVIVLAIVVWSLKRRRDPKLNYHEPAGFKRLLPSITGMTDGDLVGGNTYKIIQNGAFFPALLDDIAKAKASINFETYLWKKGKISDTIIDALCEKARHGVEVRLLVDASGGSGVNLAARRKLRHAGGKFEKYHPYRLGNLGRLNNRDHRKVVVIDGRIGYVGGHCVTDDWLGDAEDKRHFRDISARVEGPVVNRMQSCFSENWIEVNGEVLPGEKFFPLLDAVGDIQMHLAYTTALGSTSALELLYFLAVHAATKNISIQNPYFLPDPHFIDAINDAANRGVDVRIMLPATTATDHPIVQHASHHHFGTFLKHGIRIFEYGKTLLHQKVMTVDGVWSLVGSANFDDRSFELNDEVGLGIYDSGFAADLEAIFEADLKYCQELNFEDWSRRGVGHKLIDGSVYLINEQL
jgi:cardiolipin synthase